MRRIYIATHGEMSLGIKDSLKLIAGDSADEIQTYSLIPGKNALDFIQEVESDILKNQDTQFIIMGDLYGASIVNSMLLLAKYENVILLSGVNLSMALQVLLAGPNDFTEMDIENILLESKSGIKRLVLPEKETDENNEF